MIPSLCHASKSAHSPLRNEILVGLSHGCMAGLDPPRGAGCVWDACSGTHTWHQPLCPALPALHDLGSAGGPGGSQGTMPHSPGRSSRGWR